MTIFKSCPIIKHLEKLHCKYKPNSENIKTDHSHVLRERYGEKVCWLDVSAIVGGPNSSVAPASDTQCCNPIRLIEIPNNELQIYFQRERASHMSGEMCYLLLICPYEIADTCTSFKSAMLYGSLTRCGTHS